MASCECSDPGCPVCKGKCTNKAKSCLSRIDMEDITGTLFCRGCGEDAFESGLFTENIKGWIAGTRAKVPKIYVKPAKEKEE
jgi:hypothetical protein